MKTTFFNIKKQLNSFNSIVESMLALSGMIKGSFGITYHQCGKTTCWCANPEVKGHLYTKLMWTDDKGPKTRSVKGDEIQTILEAIGQYREFKELRKDLRNEMQKLEKLLIYFERKTSDENRYFMDNS